MQTKMKKTDIAQAYEKYLGPKCSRTTYYKNIRAGMGIIEALKPIPHEKRYPKRVKTKKFAAELKRYHEQPGDKVNKSRFYQRLYQGWCKEEAIMVDAPVHYTRLPKKVKPQYIRPQMPTPKPQVSADRLEIGVKYTREEAKVFGAEYVL